MPIEVRELHIRVVVQDTSEATLPGGALAAEGDTSQYPDHKNWIDVTAVNIGGHKPGGGAAGDDAPTEEVSFAYARAEVQHTEGDFLFQADADATGMLRAVAQDDPFDHGDGSVRFIRDSIDGGVWTGGGRDILIGGAGADHLDATDSPSGELDPQGRLLLGSEQGIWRDGDFDGGGKDDLATCQPVTFDTDLPLSTADTGGIPVSMAEYALLLF